MYQMKWKYIFVAVFFAGFSLSASAQKKKKKDKEELTPIQLAQIHQGYKKVFQDSLGFTAAVADTVASVERNFMLKKRKILLDRSLADDEKDMMIGMLDADRDAQLGAIISIYDLDRFRAFMLRNTPKRQR